jgi:preprotein translocase subunit SecG
MRSWDEDGEVWNALARVIAWAIAAFLALALAISVLARDPGVFLALAGSFVVVATLALIAFVAMTLVLFGLFFAARLLVLFALSSKGTSPKSSSQL